MGNLTQRDGAQIERYEHDETNGAKRVYIVGGSGITASFDTSEIAASIASAVKESLGEGVTSLEAKEVVKFEIVEVEKPVVVKEPKIVEVEKQVVVTQKEIVYVDKPVIMEKIVYKEIEKPIIVNGSIQKEQKLSPVVAACMIIQAIAILALAVLK